MSERVVTVGGPDPTRLLSEFDRQVVGTEFYVGPNATGAGDDGRSGRSEESSLATLTYALTLVTASKGDVIHLLPGHAETIVAAIDINKIGVSIIGHGNGKLRPAITCNAAIDCMTVTVADVRIKNIYFPASTLTAVTARINVAAATCVIEDCLFLVGEFDLETITIAAGGDDLTIRNCQFISNAAGEGDAAIEIEAVGVDGLQVIDCHFDGFDDTQGWDTGAINSGVAHTRCLIKGNTTLYGPGIIFSAAATGMIVGNSCTEGTIGSMIDPGSCMCIGNYESDAVDETGSLFPQASPVGGGVETDVAAILVDTAVIGALGVGLSDLGGMATAMKDEVQIEMRGNKVSFAAADVLDGVQNTVFTVGTGRVLILNMIAQTSGAANAAGASATNFIFNPTTGTDSNLCGTLDIDADEQNSIYSMTGTPGDAMTGGTDGNAVGMTAPVILDTGTIDVKSAADSGSGGALLAVDIWYLPIDTGATVA